jgi:DNA-directed RNA polymerase, mitochondrial
VRWLPNFVHPLDAAHLLRTVNAAVAGGISAIATVHDSFACLPSRAARFRQLIQEEFVRMYQEHDVLAEVYEHARADLRVGFETHGCLAMRRESSMTEAA